ncbi:WD40/YVTN/BNR-like repeat-containing protein [Pontimicrobium aquaticum]|uniref:Oxidoreductase n=1 Tax=Pontimicrobium aquaticum TaxID=2565367 RepID=A0A4U0EW64_9FLAO|nr:oxidoreductase [Pontimicrobium aquaticum]TJY36153.1 oxidoreductase [Pontimicrobium aquaticum]
MKQLITLFLLISFFSCKTEEKFIPRDFNTVEVETILEDSLLSVRAIDILDDDGLAFAANNNSFGLYDPAKNTWNISKQKQDSLKFSFRSVAHTSTDFFMLTVANPALLYKTTNSGMQLVYREDHDNVFYDAMNFWNDNEGIAIGDSIDGCISIIITRDGGNTWTKLPCDQLPPAKDGEGAFAASNTNIVIVGDNTWVATTAGRIYYSADKGKTWEFVSTPIVNDKDTEGIYSVDFYDELHGFAIGGDYTNPDSNKGNKAKTIDGGKTWKLVADGQTPNYRSCVQYIPNRNGQELVAVGFKGIDYSNDGGETWKTISDEGFFTIRFIDETTAYAAGSGRISKITLK